MGKVRGNVQVRVRTVELPLLLLRLRLRLIKERKREERKSVASKVVRSNCIAAVGYSQPVAANFPGCERIEKREKS